MTTSNTTDPTLIRRSAGGDTQAFETLVRRHQASVYRFLLTVAEEEAEAQDALQECFVAAWRSAGTFSGDGSARGWLLTIARNALSRAHRRRAGEPTSFEPLEALGARAGWGSVGNPDAELDRLAARESVQRAMSALSSEEREVLTLRDLEGFSGGEVVGMLSISPSAMKSRLHRARLKLVAELKEMDDGKA
jgi:RNA polymerase sigma-70 factor (ECF subfamily)